MKTQHLPPHLRTWSKKRTRAVLVHTAFIMLGVDFIALIIPEIGIWIAPLHEALYRTGGVLACAVYYMEG